jgi:hypothetical protein
MSNAPAATTRRFATVKKGIVTNEEAEQKMREKFERRTKTVNQKRIVSFLKSCLLIILIYFFFSSAKPTKQRHNFKGKHTQPQ